MRMVAAGVMLAMVAACSGSGDEEEAVNAAALANYSPPFVMSRLDFGGVVERRFRRLDHNGDDRLELRELNPRTAQARMKAMDRNGDGVLSNQEWSEGMMARFDAQDLNKDGTLTSDERERALSGTEEALPTPADEPGGNSAAASAAR
jgi:hypothetical protein